MPLGMEVGLGPGPGRIVLHGDPALPPKGEQPPNFGPCLLWPNGRPSQLLLRTCYIMDLIRTVISSIGCCVFGCFINILSYADDLVLLAPSWCGMQRLLDVLQEGSIGISMSVNL